MKVKAALKKITLPCVAAVGLNTPVLANPIVNSHTNATTVTLQINPEIAALDNRGELSATQSAMGLAKLWEGILLSAQKDGKNTLGELVLNQEIIRVHKNGSGVINAILYFHDYALPLGGKHELLTEDTTIKQALMKITTFKEAIVKHRAEIMLEAGKISKNYNDIFGYLGRNEIVDALMSIDLEKTPVHFTITEPTGGKNIGAIDNTAAEILGAQVTFVGNGYYAAPTEFFNLGRSLAFDGAKNLGLNVENPVALMAAVMQGPFEQRNELLINKVLKGVVEENEHSPNVSEVIRGLQMASDKFTQPLSANQFCPLEDAFQRIVEVSNFNTEEKADLTRRHDRTLGINSKVAKLGGLQKAMELCK